MKIEIDSVELNFDDKKILYGVYLKAETGKVTGVLGRNGCGKTCLLRILFGDLKPKYKNVRIDEKYLKTNLFKTGKVAYLPQHQLLPNNISLKKVFHLFLSDWKIFTSIFESFKIHENSRTNEISSGELRVIETYLILNSGKEIILLDEPFSFIAPLYIEKFKTIIQEKKNKSAVLITDHFYREILDVSDTIYLIKNGSSKLIQSRQDLENEGYISFNSLQK
ncbi:ATP-binding cassette domain-containing protein [Maribacter sp. 2308TA10-17]|uniref:ATP-binding cassette domain-containing protein n=1 Tax=Maribacter sp. 2308TA10-17 TaxID=3386276 RepID=UPI0039BC7E92